ncbi:MAG: DPP IV N-terminal domain-containing protein [Alphaproteobacteria bacterium]|jgi:TolB protein|nr:DPP IV N-terminal domain-containing protein [Alphaproteobacteria bacterium]
MRKLFLVIIIVLYSQISQAFDLEVDVLSEDYQPISLLISDFYVDDNSAKMYDSLKTVFSRDIKNSGVFDLRFSYEQILVGNVDLKNAFSEIDISPYNHYQYIVVGKINYSAEERSYNIEVSVVNSQGHILKNVGYNIKSSPSKKEITRLGHDIANEIYEAALEIPGYFTSSLLFVDGNRLMMSNYDGEDMEVVLKTRGTIFAPSFSYDGKMIVYMDFYEGRSEIFLYDVYFKKIMRLANFKGLSLAPSFSRDNKKIILAVANEGSTHIYEVSLKSGTIAKLTSGYSINIPGNYSLNNQYVVFNSDRAGSPKIYTLNPRDGIVNRLSKGIGNYYTPSFAPNSNLILFTKIYSGDFQIGLLSLSGSEKIVSHDTFAESPSWLVDGRHIVYHYAYKKLKDKNLYSFYIMDLLSGHKLLIRPTEDAQDPSLSYGVIPTKKISAKYYF